MESLPAAVWGLSIIILLGFKLGLRFKDKNPLKWRNGGMAATEAVAVRHLRWSELSWRRESAVRCYFKTRWDQPTGLFLLP